MVSAAPRRLCVFCGSSAGARPHFLTAAQELGLAADALLRPASERWDDKVRDDYDSGVASGVEGTPALFVDGVRFEGGPSLRRVLEAVDRA